MDDNREINCKKYHSSYVVLKTPKESSNSETMLCKSEFNVALPNAFSIASRHCDSDLSQNNIFREYYKRYEHDEIPVKDLNRNSVPLIEGSLTSSDKDNLEINLFKNVSRQLQTENSTICSLESNIKFFKATVEEIFVNFYSCMQDFELYKKRYQEILSKNREDSVADMEDFIKDMIQHIMSSETVASQSRKATESYTEKDINVDTEISEGLNTVSNLTTTTDTSGVLEAYKNYNYLTDSTLDNNSSNKRYSINETHKSLQSAPCLQFRINNTHDKIIPVASDDKMNFAAKRKEMEKYIIQRHGETRDIEIPVKVSYAKKNIYLNEDFMRESADNRQSFISKICNFLCKKFRKNSFI